MHGHSTTGGQGTRSKKEQGCYRARQRLHGLLRGVAVNAALAFGRTRWCGGESDGLGRAGVANRVCSMLLLS